MGDQAWLDSHYHAVHQLLLASLEGHAGNVAPGTQGAIGRAIHHFRGSDRAALARLEAISLLVSRLQLALREKRRQEQRMIRHGLKRLTDEWMREAPMFPRLEGASSTRCPDLKLAA